MTNYAQLHNNVAGDRDVPSDDVVDGDAWRDTI